MSEITIAALLGHSEASVTSRYEHHADAVIYCRRPIVSPMRSRGVWAAKLPAAKLPAALL